MPDGCGRGGKDDVLRYGGRLWCGFEVEKSDLFGVRDVFLLVGYGDVVEVDVDDAWLSRRPYVGEAVEDDSLA